MSTDQDRKPKRKRRPKPGDVASLRRVLWGAIRDVESVIEEGDRGERLRAVSVLATVSGVYLKALEVHDLEARLAALEASQGVRRAA